MDEHIPDFIEKLCNQEAIRGAAQFLKKLQECIAERSEALNDDLRILSCTEYLKKLKMVLITSKTNLKVVKQENLKKSHVYENLPPVNDEKPSHTCENPPSTNDVKSSHTYENIRPVDDMKTLDTHENETQMDVEYDHSNSLQVVENMEDNSSQNSKIQYCLTTPSSSAVDVDDIYQSQAQLLPNIGPTSPMPLTSDCRLMLTKRKNGFKLRFYQKIMDDIPISNISCVKLEEEKLDVEQTNGILSLWMREIDHRMHKFRFNTPDIAKTWANLIQYCICNNSNQSQLNKLIPRNADSARNKFTSLSNTYGNNIASLNSTYQSYNLLQVLKQGPEQIFIRPKSSRPEQNRTEICNKSPTYVTMRNQYPRPTSSVSQVESDNIYENPYESGIESGNTSSSSLDHLYEEPLQANWLARSKNGNLISNAIRGISAPFITDWGNNTSRCSGNRHNQQVPVHRDQSYSDHQRLRLPSIKSAAAKRPLPPLPNEACSPSKSTRKSFDISSHCGHSYSSSRWNPLYYTPPTMPTNHILSHPKRDLSAIDTNLNIFESHISFCLCYFKDLSSSNAIKYCALQGSHGTFLLRKSEEDEFSYSLTFMYENSYHKKITHLRLKGCKNGECHFGNLIYPDIFSFLEKYRLDLIHFRNPEAQHCSLITFKNRENPFGSPENLTEATINEWKEQAFLKHNQN